MHVLAKYFPITIPKPDKLAEMIMQAYLLHVYVTFGGSLTLVTDNGGESRMTCFEMWQKNWVINTSLPAPTTHQSNEILKKIPLLFRCIIKTYPITN